MTELDLRRVNLSEATVSYLQEAMPKVKIEDNHFAPVEDDHKGEVGYDYDRWLDDLFLPARN